MNALLIAEGVVACFAQYLCNGFNNNNTSDRYYFVAPFPHKQIINELGKQTTVQEGGGSRTSFFIFECDIHWARKRNFDFRDSNNPNAASTIDLKCIMKLWVSTMWRTGIEFLQGGSSPEAIDKLWSLPVFKMVFQLLVENEEFIANTSIEAAWTGFRLHHFTSHHSLPHVRNLRESTSVTTLRMQTRQNDDTTVWQLKSPCYRAFYVRVFIILGGDTPRLQQICNQNTYEGLLFTQVAAALVGSFSKQLLYAECDHTEVPHFEATFTEAMNRITHQVADEESKENLKQWGQGVLQRVYLWNSDPDARHEHLARVAECHRTHIKLTEEDDVLADSNPFAISAEDPAVVEPEPPTPTSVADVFDGLNLEQLPELSSTHEEMKALNDGCQRSPSHSERSVASSTRRLGRNPYFEVGKPKLVDDPASEDDDLPQTGSRRSFPGKKRNRRWSSQSSTDRMEGVEEEQSPATTEQAEVTSEVEPIADFCESPQEQGSEDLHGARTLTPSDVTVDSTADRLLDESLARSRSPRGGNEAASMVLPEPTDVPVPVLSIETMG